MRPQSPYIIERKLLSRKKRQKIQLFLTNRVAKITTNLKNKFRKAGIFKTLRNSKHADCLQQR